jgi:hypothetical protein
MYLAGSLRFRYSHAHCKNRFLVDAIKAEIVILYSVGLYVDKNSILGYHTKSVL